MSVTKKKKQIKVKILRHKINKVMGELQSRFHAHNLMINTEETMAVSFHRRQNINLLKPQVT